MDGLEQVLYKVCIENPYYNLNFNQQLFAKNKIGIENLNVKRETNVTCIRFADDIFIFGLVNKTILEKIEIPDIGAQASDNSIFSYDPWPK